MNKIKYIVPLVAPLLLAFTYMPLHQDHQRDDLRAMYSKPISQWPKPWIDEGVMWEELSSVAYDNSFYDEQQKPLASLGKLLFFDPRLSGSNQISCSSCHDPHMSWADGREIALGHDHLQGPRNSISILNVGSRKRLFWDGRAESLQQQALEPLLAHHEMAADLKTLPKKISRIKGYLPLFEAAFGDRKISNNRIVEALAAFQLTIKSRRSKFDEFVDGDYAEMSDIQIKGLHLFRTKARCMNCHNGAYFSDHQFHNLGLTYYKREFEDLGRYRITGKAEDLGRFQTPMLRDVMNTAPWMHNGLFDDIEGVISMYNSGMHMVDPSEEEKRNDPLFPVTDPLMKPLQLTAEELTAIVAFLESITATEYKMSRPELPK